MCGRMNVLDEPLTKIVSNLLGIDFKTETNLDLCPSQLVSTVTKENTTFQVNATWGIQPSWANKLLINAQSETVSQKHTFKNAFAQHRCIVPCSGWFEWRTEAGKKVKYLFEHSDKQPLYMAGLLYAPASPKLVTLTTKPNDKCMAYHKRMPVLIAPENIDRWLSLPTEQLQPLMTAVNDDMVHVLRA